MSQERFSDEENLLKLELESFAPQDINIIKDRRRPCESFSFICDSAIGLGFMSINVHHVCDSVHLSRSEILIPPLQTVYLSAYIHALLVFLLI